MLHTSDSEQFIAAQVTKIRGLEKMQVCTKPSMNYPLERNYQALSGVTGTRDALMVNLSNTKLRSVWTVRNNNMDGTYWET
jgi:hypothetical protein